jgi:hypothetical protein
MSVLVAVYVGGVRLCLWTTNSYSLQRACYLYPRWYMSMGNYGGLILTEESRRSLRNAFPSATLSTTNPIWTDSGANLHLLGERPATNRLNLCMVSCWSLLASEADEWDYLSNWRVYNQYYSKPGQRLASGKHSWPYSVLTTTEYYIQTWLISSTCISGYNLRITNLETRISRDKFQGFIPDAASYKLKVCPFQILFDIASALSSQTL